MTEYRVLWRWKIDPYREEYTPERRKVYLTRRGAERQIARLSRNGGRYEHIFDSEPTRYDDGFRMEVWHLDYVHLETRSVGEWVAS